MDLTQQQIDQLNSLGINVDDKQINSLPVKEDVDSSTESIKPSEPELPPQPTPEPPQPEELKIENCELKIKRPVSPVFPLLSISGLTLLSFGGLVLLKGNGSQTTKISSTINDLPSTNSPSPTQVPKSIQHYLLTSQQYFSQAIQQQTDVGAKPSNDNQSTIDLLNNSILAATEAIKEFPSDYRGYQQRATIYQALTDSKPDLIDQSISDFATAFKLNPQSAEVTRSLANLYAKKGDANKTIAYLTQTVNLEPTKVQNFYDLAKIQQQAGLLGDALDTYNKLIPLITDPTQKTQVESEKTTIESIIAKNPDVGTRHALSSPNEENSQPSTDSPTIQASAGSSLIIAAPEEDESIKVTNQTDSNSLSGNAILPVNQKEITISNDNVTSTSQVYVTVTKGGKNQNFQVISKSDKSFTAGLDSPINEDVEFKWWIIN